MKRTFIATMHQTTSQPTFISGDACLLQTESYNQSQQTHSIQQVCRWLATKPAGYQQNLHIWLASLLPSVPLPAYVMHRHDMGLTAVLLVSEAHLNHRPIPSAISSRTCTTPTALLEKLYIQHTSLPAQVGAYNQRLC